MDPIAHTLVGATLAQTGLGRKSACATAALVIGANLPDIDGVAIFMGGDTSLFYRRGWTHGIPALIVLPFLLTGLLVAWGRLWGSSESIRPRVLLGLSSLAAWSHPSLDWLNTYGMRWLMPFDGRWFYGDTLYVVDPWFWLSLGSAVFLFRSRRLPSVLVWIAFVSFTAYLLFTSVPGLAWAKALWVVAIAAVIALRLRGVGGDEPSARRWAAGALVALCVYIGVMHATMRDVRQIVTETLEERGIRVERMMAGPVPVTPFVRDIVVETLEGYRFGRAHLLPSFELELSPTILPLLDESPEVRAATESPRARGFMNWARFPFADVEEADTGCVVYLLDARYTRVRVTGFGSARVEVQR